MSSNIRHIDFGPPHARLLREILRRAGYVSERMEPLAGAERQASLILLRRFNRELQPSR